ncbi:MAG TPA: hypothetical protein PLK68_12295, partial [Thomasclavelia ramosa]|nr:hypothetical protein [Thomasclavelia ramosa]
MKILYISRKSFSDSDFPLLRELQETGIEVDAYFLGDLKSSGILEFDKKSHFWGIKRASEFNEVSKFYGQYVNLRNFFFVSFPNGRKGEIIRLFEFFYLYYHLKRIDYDVIHLIWPLNGFSERLLYKLKPKILCTVHDPIPHSGQEWQE